MMISMIWGVKLLRLLPKYGGKSSQMSAICLSRVALVAVEVVVGCLNSDNLVLSICLCNHQSSTVKHHEDIRMYSIPSYLLVSI